MFGGGEMHASLVSHFCHVMFTKISNKTNESLRHKENFPPSVGPPVKVSSRVSGTIDVLDLTSNCQAYALTTALSKSWACIPISGLRPSDVQTHQSV